MCSYDNSTPIRSPQIVTCLPVAFVLCKLCSEHMNTITIYGMIVMRLCVGRNKLDVSFGEEGKSIGIQLGIEPGTFRFLVRCHGYICYPLKVPVKNTSQTLLPLSRLDRWQRSGRQAM